MARTSRPVEVFVSETSGFVGRHRSTKKRTVVGTKYTDQLGGYGVCAEIYVEQEFLYFVADPYDNHFMIDVETIPALIKELQRLQRIQKKAA